MLRLLVSFALFATIFGAYYEDSADYWIQKINSDPTSSFKAGVNDYFRGKSLRDMTRLMGTYMDKPKLPVKEYAQVDALPKSFVAGVDKWQNCANTVGFIWDQANCGSCWAVAASAMAGDRTCIMDMKNPGSENVKSNFPKQPDVGLSAELLMSCCHSCGDGCRGGYPYQAMNFWHQTGLVTGGSYGSGCGCQPYEIAPCPPGGCSGPEAQTPPCKQTCRNGYSKSFAADKHHAQSAYHVHHTEEQIMQDIYTHGPVEAAFSVYMNFMHYHSGIYDHTEGSYLGGHAVKIVGWGEESGKKYWLINNSWNTTWGQTGQFKFLRGTDLCGMESNIVAGHPKTETDVKLTC